MVVDVRKYSHMDKIRTATRQHPLPCGEIHGETVQGHEKSMYISRKCMLRGYDRIRTIADGIWFGHLKIVSQ